MTILIDPEFRSLIPPLSPDELAGLTASLLAEGCRDALVVWQEQGILLDGHNRYAICQQHNLHFETVAISLADRNAALVWIIRNQFSRRNLLPFIRAELALKLKPLIAEMAKGNQRAAGGAIPVIQKSGEAIRTDKEIAKAAGVSHDTIHKAEIISKKAPESVKAKLRSGEASINAVYTTVVRAERESKRELRRTENAAKAAAAPDPLKAGAKFSTLLIDPPWDWGDEGDVNQMGRAKPDYATMPLADLLALPVADLADTDAHLYLWATNRSMPKAFELMAAWGFRYICLLTWPKPSIGMGNYFRGQTEHLLFGVRGSLALLRKDASTLLPQWNRGKGHSSKPLEIYPFIESCSPGPYIELFARNRRDGWAHWGADA